MTIIISKSVFRISLVALLFGIVYSCDLDSAKETTIRGQVLTYGTDEVIDHPPVLMQLVQEKIPGCFGCNSYYEVKDEVVTDELGKYSLNHKLYDDEFYFLKVEESSVKSFHGYIVPSFSSIDNPENRITNIGGQTRKNYHLTAYGWVRFHFVSENPQVGDVYWYSVGGGEYEEFYDSMNVIRIWDFAGNQMHRITYGIERDGQFINYNEELFVPAFDTIDYAVRF